MYGNSNVPAKCAPVFYVFDVKLFYILTAEVWEIRMDGAWGRKSVRGRRQGFVVEGSEGEGVNPIICKVFTHNF